MQFTENKFFSELFEVPNLSFAAYSLYQIRFCLSRTFSKLFSKFLKQFFRNSNFSDRHLFRNSLFIISNSLAFVKNFFSFFSNLFRSTAAPLSDSFNRIPQELPPCQHNFSIFAKILLNTKNAPLLPAIGVSGASAQFIFGKRSCSMTASRVMPAYAICARPSMKRETAATSTEMLSATNGMVFSSASEPSMRVLCLR